MNSVLILIGFGISLVIGFTILVSLWIAVKLTYEDFPVLFYKDNKNASDEYYTE